MIKAVIFDMDGTINRGRAAIPGAKEMIKKLREKNIQTIFLTNAATRSREGFRKKLLSIGIEVNEVDGEGGGADDAPCGIWYEVPGLCVPREFSHFG